MWKYVLIVTFVTGLFGFGYYMYDSVTTTIKTLIEQNAQLKYVAEQNKQELDRILEDIRIIAIENETVSTEFDIANSIVDKLNAILSKHDLGMLALERPGLVENRINNAANELNRCFEILSGSQLTLEEINATRKSEINDFCSDLANPNYNN
jgi:hypothetical protein